jgi:hypothetical protein
MRRMLACFFLAVTGAMALGQTEPAPTTPPAAPAPATRPAAPAATQPNPMSRFDPAAIKAQVLSRMKTAIEPTDEEWKIIEPKLVKIILLQMDATPIGSMGGGMRGFRIGSMVRMILDPDAPPSQVEERLNELQKMIAENETSTDFYRNKLTQLRKARAAAKEQLEIAQKDLISVLTIRQEAGLVQLGILD